LQVSAIVFMKEYSERIPHKNTRLMNGKPLFYWIMSTLLATEVNEIYIDTDSKNIADEISNHFYDKRIRIFDRRDSVKGDHVTANALIRTMLDRVRGEHFLQTHATNPLLKPETINKAIRVYQAIPKDMSLLGVNVYQSNFYDYTGKAINHDPHLVTRSQDRRLTFEENSNLYIFSREQFYEYGRVSDGAYLYPISKLESIDIDIEDDWKLAEAVMACGV
jgi:CMP-N-acetylneuraminic acid synthetase